MTEMESILSILNIRPSLKSRDYIENKKEFQLHDLLTEQRHKGTWDLSSVLGDNIGKGLKQILSIDNDISRKFKKMTANPDQLKKPVDAVKHAVENDKKIFTYGCGSTGRLAKQLESSLWRPFWSRLKQSRHWAKVMPHIRGDIENRFIGEMTGGDRALISSLEGFEDLQLVGELQLKGHGIRRGDVVFCISEGGETSSVIGAVQAAAGLYRSSETSVFSSSSKYIFFIFNNPDELVRPFERSRRVLEHPGIDIPLDLWIQVYTPLSDTRNTLVESTQFS